MTNEEAQMILQSCRRGAEGDSDPLIAQALACAERDPELKAWWEAECAIDAAIRRKLNDTTVPANLAERIIAAQSRRPSVHTAARIRYLALAASLVLFGLSVALLLSRGRPESKTEFMAFREDMGQFLKVFPRLDLETEKMADVRAWLSQRSWLTDVELPRSLQRFPTIGCREMQWQGRRAALVCFMVDGEVIHLFLLPSASFANFPTEPSPEVKQASGLTTAAWRRGDTIYFAVTKGKPAFLEKHVRT